MKKILSITLFCTIFQFLSCTDAASQQETVTSQQVASTIDSIQIRKMYTHALTKGKSYDWLNYLSNRNRFKQLILRIL